ncbi:hypothetical protein QVD17_20767 [Tagetes erecta]|uniref:Uncharacterized protein n=1 Tax=Tagetes erecta TaxID=13708 RepID=A0AAD8NRA4_TARER|nr:hypothetical protein QVD17_20767 [Tagetes erecta]
MCEASRSMLMMTFSFFNSNWTSNLDPYLDLPARPSRRKPFVQKAPIVKNPSLDHDSNSPPQQDRFAPSFPNAQPQHYLNIDTCIWLLPRVPKEPELVPVKKRFLEKLIHGKLVLKKRLISDCYSLQGK